MFHSDWSRRLSKVLFVAAAILFGAGLNAAHAETKFGSMTRIAIGWNLIHIQVCVAGQANGVDYLIVVSTTGDQLVTTDPIVIGDAVNFCANGNGFYLYTPDGVTVQQYAFYPHLT